MADVNVKVLEPATEIGFLSLDEAKRLLGVTNDTTVDDEALQMQINIASATIMRCCNRMFAKEKVEETWRDVYDGRLFLTHFPVAEEDLESVFLNGGTAPLDPASYVLEEESGKLSNYGGWTAPATVTYTGGYDLPDEAPWPLKGACWLLVREQRLLQTRESLAGVRSISHKESRVMFFDPAAQLKAASLTGGQSKMGTGSPQADALLYHYCRIWV